MDLQAQSVAQSERRHRARQVIVQVDREIAA
jgi:hypothetical protein